MADDDAGSLVCHDGQGRVVRAMPVPVPSKRAL
jgi:hypothetical protein